MKIAFPNSHAADSFKEVIAAEGGSSFFDKLSKFFDTENIDGIDEKGVKEFAGACRSLKDAYSDFITSSNKEQFLKKIKGNLSTIVGAAIWERVLMRARTQAFEKGFDKEIFGKAKEAFKANGMQITVKAEPEQTGTKKTEDHESIVSDSLVKINISCGEDVVLTITVGDSSKFSQARWYTVSPTQKQTSDTIRV